MAVSYDNVSVIFEQKDGQKEKHGAFIYVYAINNDKSEIKQYYKKIREILLPSKYKTLIGDQSVFGIATQFMAFSDNNNYIMLNYQQINKYGYRKNDESFAELIIWDLQSDTAVKDEEVIQNIKFGLN